VVFRHRAVEFPAGDYGREAIMSLLAGNAVLLKPASLTPLIALKLRELFDDAGLDPDLFQVVTCAGSTASQLIEAGVDYVNFTGSTGTGRKVAELCGRKMIPHSWSWRQGFRRSLADADHNRGASVVGGAFANSGTLRVGRARVRARSIYSGSSPRPAT
jgi:succinate-semialdehyde dehydrogenase/glutarate-semialdehyde dehydrogenase